MEQTQCGEDHSKVHRGRFWTKISHEHKNICESFINIVLRKTNIALQKTVIKFIGYMTTEVTVQTNADQFSVL